MLKKILAINSDILFQSNLTEFLDHHIDFENDITVGTAKYFTSFPMVWFKSTMLINFQSRKSLFLNLMYFGIYIVNKEVLSKFKTTKLDMDNLIKIIQEINNSIGYYDIGPKWMDVGSEGALELANKFINLDII